MEEQRQVNIYGSRLYEGGSDTSREEESEGGDGDYMEVDNRSANREFCCCKSQCCVGRSAQQARGCSCKGAGLFCTNECKCGSKTKPCRNKQQCTVPLSDPNVGNNSGENRNIRRTVAVEEVAPIRDVLSELTGEELLEAAARVFEHDRNRLRDVLRHIRQDDQETNTDDTSEVPYFCRCRHCRLMPTEVENKCCGQPICRASTAVFENICLDKENVETAIRNLSDSLIFTPMYENKSMRHSAYRQYVMWQHGHVRARRRIVIPSCCVWKIRNSYPSPTNTYTGFIPARMSTFAN